VDRRTISKLIAALVVCIIVFTLCGPAAQAQDEATISLIAPADIAGWDLSPEGAQPKTQAGTLHVTVSGNLTGSWAVTASDLDTANTNGHMTRYNGNHYTGVQLGSPLQIQGPAGTVTLPAGGNVATGTAEVDQDYPITFRQNIAWTDPVGDYRIVVTFTGSIVP
jgi:hypothetical protein